MSSYNTNDEFNTYVAKTKQLYFDRYGKFPKFNGFYMMNSVLQETLMRCNIEATHFGIKDDIDSCVILAECINIRDRLKRTNY